MELLKRNAIGTDSAAEPRERAVSSNVYAVEGVVSADERHLVNGHKGGVLWLTGLSGAGKTTLALALERRLFDWHWQVTVLDGDNLRHGLCGDLGFSPTDRSENIRRAAEAAALLAGAGSLVLASFISPYQSDREMARRIIGDDFHEVHVDADLETCEGRDPKGLYARARRGEIPEFTGVSAPYEAPRTPEIHLDTADRPLAACVDRVSDYLSHHFIVDHVPLGKTG